MDKVWRVVSIIAVIAIILGALSILAGFVTGGDFERIRDIFVATSDIESQLDALRQIRIPIG